MPPMFWPSSTAVGTSDETHRSHHGRLEQLRGTAPGFRNLANYIADSLLDTGGFRIRLPSPAMSRLWE